MKLKRGKLLSSNYFIILIIVFFTRVTFSVETCSRTAIINFQEVLVDTSSSSKGDGLKYYLEKDPKAKSYFEKYRKESRPQWLTASIGTFGTSLILAGLFSSSSQDKSGLSNKDILVLGGAATLLLNFLVAKTFDYNNAKYLKKSVDEYNKRNLPRIYFDPFKEVDPKGRIPNGSFGLSAGLIKDF